MKIFIIDDDQLSIFLTRHKLVLEGLDNIQDYLSAEEALEYISTCPVEDIPDIIFLDLNMPVLTGWEFLDALAPFESKIRNRCQIYILTSSLDISDTAHSKEYSIVSGLIHKPINCEDIKIIKDNVRN
jgi:CheY-like chemotaxis protein